MTFLDLNAWLTSSRWDGTWFSLSFPLDTTAMDGLPSLFPLFSLVSSLWLLENSLTCSDALSTSNNRSPPLLSSLSELLSPILSPVWLQLVDLNTLTPPSVTSLVPTLSTSSWDSDSPGLLLLFTTRPSAARTTKYLQEPLDSLSVSSSPCPWSASLYSLSAERLSEENSVDPGHSKLSVRSFSYAAGCSTSSWQLSRTTV